MLLNLTCASEPLSYNIAAIYVLKINDYENIIPYLNYDDY